ncbi:MAG TPA: hypothetical protein VIH97_04630 [Candidatus Acidoferrales bacterium]|jgi:hypothetical protein
MIALILYLGVGLGLFVLLYFLARRSHAPVEGSAHQFVEARSSLQTLEQGLLPRDMIARIFDRQDLQYVTTKVPAEIRGLFLAERKRISLSWVRRVRQEVVNLMHFHRAHSRFYVQLSLPTEIRLAFDFAGLLLACRLLEAIFYLRGPYAAPRMVNLTASAAMRLCVESEKSLAFLNAANIDQFRNKTTPGGAVV